MIRLKTERLILRPLQLDDAYDFFEYRSDAGANRYQGWIPASPQDACDFIKQKITDTPDVPGTWIQLAILLRDTSTLIGDIGVYFIPDMANAVKLGYTLSLPYRGKGYATEALRILINHLLITYNKTKFYVSIAPENEASIRLAKRLGFVQLPQAAHPEIRDTDYPDDLLFVLDMI